MSSRINAAAVPAAMPSMMATAGDLSEGPATWYVAYTEPRQEILAQVNLRQQGFQTYLPLYKSLKKKTASQMASGGTPTLVIHEPMFPRYLFFKPSTFRQSISTVRSTRGVNSVVRFGTIFAEVQPEVLSAIQEFEQRRNHSDLHAGERLRPGQRIRLHDSGLAGLEGLVHTVSAQRVIVLMEILGRQTRIRVKRASVEPV